MLTSAG